ncbi:MAG: putative sugar nucleotidyl transferase [Gemmatimonadota bacterium]
MKLLLFDDRTADAWRPFAATRPAGELLYGAMLLRQRIERALGLAASAALSRPWLTAFAEPGAPPVRERRLEPAGEARVILCARFVPHDGPLALEDDGPLTLTSGDEVAGWLVPAGAEPPSPDLLLDPAELPGSAGREIGGSLVPGPWTLVDQNADRLAADLAADRDANSTESAEPPAGVHVLGRESLRLGDGATLEPGVVLDLTDGPIRLGDGVLVRSGARLTGPLFAASGSRLLGGSIASLSAGPRSHLRGEIEHSIVLGYSNKAHDGFLGHAYVGRWVNLGALTTNSDLKNNYGQVRLGGPGDGTDTGLRKMGCLLGDHVKSAIGTLFDTGAVVGAGANVFGATRPPKWVPPFSWGGAEDSPAFRRDAFLETARTVMGRRDVDWSPSLARWLGDVWDAAMDGRMAS